MLASREAAARELAERLMHYRGRNPLILAVPRGAAPMGAIIAEALDGELDVVLVHKLGAPGNSEFAVGAVDEEGVIQIAEHAWMTQAEDDYIRKEAERQLRVLRQRRAQYTPVREPLDPRGRIVIVVDDGAATGETVLAALRAIRRKQPARLILALGVAPAQIMDKLRATADEVVCLETPTDFWAVGQFYMEFQQVEDEEVIAILRRFGGRPASTHASAD